MSEKGFWSRMREARLLRVLAGYLAVAWIVLQVSAVVRNELDLPRWITQWVILLLLIGLGVVLATAWVQAHPFAQGRTHGLPSAWEIDLTGLTEGLTKGRLPHLTWARAILGGVVAFSILFGIAGLYVVLREPSGAGGEVATDPAVIAVLPFRVAGADPALAYLREGMMDLLAAKLTGEGGPRAADPRSVASAWRQTVGPDEHDVPPHKAMQLARSLGAGRVLLGGVVGSAGRIVINASLLSVEDGRVQAHANVEGPSDSLTALVDDLTGRLLVLEAGEGEPRLASLTSHSLPALRSYLDGQAAYRRGEYEQSSRHFARALEIDSTFALAGLGMISAGFWLAGSGQRSERGLAAAWAHRDRLSPRDRVVLTAWAGPRYPDPPSEAERLTAWERALEAVPDRPETWHQTGDRLFHYGVALGVEGAWTRAAGFFRRAAELDPTFTSPLAHLLEIAAHEGDTLEVRRLASRYFALDSTGDLADYLRWRTAVALRDDVALMDLRNRFSEMPTESLRRIVGTVNLEGITLEDAERAGAVLRERAAAPGERTSIALHLIALALNRGRPGQAQDLSYLIAESDRRASLRFHILAALYWDGQTAPAVRAVQELARGAYAPVSEDSTERARQVQDICVVEQWRLWHGDTASAQAAIDRLRKGAPNGSDQDATVEVFCAALLEALLAAAQNRPGLAASIHRFESLAQRHPPVELFRECGNLVVARLRAEQGDAAAALAAARRRPYLWLYGSFFLSSYLREEGRLAALTGDRAGAIRAYRHYLTLRADPEAALAGDVDAVKAELARLVAEKTP